jgi:two-component system, cell cycle sensor histidine kinase and response regulator CckA
MTESISPILGTPTILLVEDNEFVMELTRDVLESSGYRVETTYLPRVALNLVKEGDFHVDLLVTDVVMPQMNGPELYSRIRELLPDLPVLYMSGYSGKAIHEVMHCDKAHFLSKPFKPASLLKQVAQVLAG